MLHFIHQWMWDLNSKIKSCDPNPLAHIYIYVYMEVLPTYEESYLDDFV